MPDNIEKDSGEIDSQKVAHESSSQNNEYKYRGEILGGYLSHVGMFYIVLCQLFWSKISQLVDNQLIESTINLKKIIILFLSSTFAQSSTKTVNVYFPPPH